MKRHLMPVTMGAPEYSVIEVGPLRVTEAFFPAFGRLPPHVHARHVVAIIMDGSFDDIFPNRTFECTPSTLLVEPAEDKHANRFGDRGAHVVIVEPDPTHEELLHPCRKLFSEPTAFADPMAASLAVRLSHEMNARDELTPLAIESLALELFVSASRRVARRDGGIPMPCWLRRTTEYLNDSFRLPMRMADVADVAGVHPTHLARMFRKHHGVTVGQYVRQLRLSWSATRVLRFGVPLSRIAVEAGFTDQSHFTRAFKLAFGVTPAEYRERRTER